jgi:hypothetical protein
MRHVLVLMPEGKPGEPDWGMNGTPLGAPPEGTHTLDIQAYWSVTDPDGKFRGGVAGMKIEVATAPSDQSELPAAKQEER